MRASACCGSQSVGGANGEARLGLAEESRDADLEELVEVRREAGAELDTLEQRERVVGRELEHARVELEVRQLPVEQRVRLLGSRFRRHRILIGTAWHGVSMPEPARDGGIAKSVMRARAAAAPRLVAAAEERRRRDRAREDEHDEVARGHAGDHLHQRADEGRRGEREQPGGRDVARDAPAHVA